MKSDDYGRDYWEGGVGSEYRNYADDDWDGILAEAAPYIPQGGVVRELGSAHGYFLHHALRAGYNVEGIDISQYAYHKGLERMPWLQGINRLGNVADGLPWEDGSADMVFTSEFLEHMTDEALPVVLSEMYRILKPGGLWLHKIGIVVPDNHPHRPPTVEDHSAHFTHYTILTRDEWRDKFASMGLVENLDLTAALDKRYANRDWVMRFFAYTKGEA